MKASHSIPRWMAPNPMMLCKTCYFAGMTVPLPLDREADCRFMPLNRLSHSSKLSTASKRDKKSYANKEEGGETINKENRILVVMIHRVCMTGVYNKSHWCAMIIEKCMTSHPQQERF